MTLPTLQFSIDSNEYYLAERFMLRKRGSMISEQILGAAFLLASIIIFTIPAFFGLGILATLIGLILLSVPLFRKLGLKKRWQREAILRAKHYVQFSPAGIHYSLNEIESDLDWKYYQSWLETPDEFLLICSNDVFALIPKRAFPNDQIQAAFRELLSTKLRTE